jgi:MFS family permease
MKLKKRLLIPLAALIVAALAGWDIHHWGGLSFWVGFGIVLGAIVINGFIAEAEDNAPGGFNNPLPLFAFGILAVVLIGLLIEHRPIHRWYMIRRGNSVIVHIEAYQRTHGRIPDHLTDLGLREDERGPLYYDRKDQHYLLWFAEGSNSFGYESRTRRWTVDPPTYRVNRVAPRFI